MGMGTDGRKKKGRFRTRVKLVVVSSSIGTSTGTALPRTGIGNLRVWVPTCCTSTATEKPMHRRTTDGLHQADEESRPAIRVTSPSGG